MMEFGCGLAACLSVPGFRAVMIDDHPVIYKINTVNVNNELGDQLLFIHTPGLSANRDNAALSYYGLITLDYMEENVLAEGGPSAGSALFIITAIYDG